MSKQSIIEMLDEHGIPYQAKEKDNVYVECPRCTRDKLSINVYSGEWHCWSGECKALKGEEKMSGDFRKLREVLDLKTSNFKPTKAPPKIKRLKKSELETIINSTRNKSQVIDWCVSRGLESKPVLAYGVGYWKEKRAIIIPFRDMKGNIIGCKCKAENGSQWIMGKEPPLFIIDPEVLKKQKVVVVEGEPDVFTLNQFGIPVVGVLGIEKSEGLRLLRSVREIYLGYDMDGAGEEGVEKAIAELGPYRCKRVHWYRKDPNDMLKAGYTIKGFIKALKKAEPCATEMISKTATERMRMYLVEKKKKKSKKFTWGYEGLDDLTHGIHPGWCGAIVAETGVGKTTVLLNIGVANVEEGTPIGIASFEEDPNFEISPKLTAMFCERNPGGGKFKRKELLYAKPYLDKVHMFDGDEHDHEGFIKWVHECYYVYGIRLILADYLQLLVPDEKDIEKLKRACYRFGKRLCKQLPGLSIIWCIQPKQRAKSSYQGKIVQDSEVEARGGTTIKQSVDVNLTIKPVKGHSDIVQCEFTKVRGQLEVSKKDWLYKLVQLEYDHSTMRQYELNNLIYGGE